MTSSRSVYKRSCASNLNFFQQDKEKQHIITPCCRLPQFVLPEDSLNESSHQGIQNAFVSRVVENQITVFISVYSPQFHSYRTGITYKYFLSPLFLDFKIFCRRVILGTEQKFVPKRYDSSAYKCALFWLLKFLSPGTRTGITGTSRWFQASSDYFSVTL